MTGIEFQSIRRANFITQKQLALQLNRSLSRVQKVEKLEYIPTNYIKALSELLGVDLFDESKLEKIKNGIPEKYKERRPYYRNPSLW